MARLNDHAVLGACAGGRFEGFVFGASLDIHFYCDDQHLNFISDQLRILYIYEFNLSLMQKSIALSAFVRVSGPISLCHTE